MLTIYDDATYDAALNNLPASEIRDTLFRIVQDAKASDLWTLTCVLLVQASDDEAELRETLGFDPLVGPLREVGSAFEPYWSWLERHRDHYEMLITAGDEGFANFVLVSDEPDAPLTRLLAAHSASTGDH